MSLKHHTIIFVPHARARLRKWRVTNRQLGIAIGTFSLVTLSALYIAWSFFTTTIDRREIARLEAENASLRQVNGSFEQSIAQLENRLASYEDRTRKLAILAGLDTSSSGIGGASLSLSEENPQGELEHISTRAESLAETLKEVGAKLEEQARWVSSMPTIVPVKGLMSSGFGVRKDPIHGGPAMHTGIDFSAPFGAPVYASADGIVTHAGRSSGLGKSVYISHGFGITTRYGHLSRIAAEEGKRVKRGDLIGYVGNTGRSTGYHLHYEVRVDGKPENPIGYLLDYTRRR